MTRPPLLLALLTLLPALSARAADDGWKNFYGIAWRDTPHNAILYSKQMGYEYLVVKSGSRYAYTNDYRSDPDSAGLHFFISNPFYDVPLFLDMPGASEVLRKTAALRYINQTLITYTPAQQDWYNRRALWKSPITASNPWPLNLATGWFTSIQDNVFEIVWDFQQQAVIDEVVEKTIASMHAAETTTFKFAGYIVDVPTLNGDIHRIVGNTQPMTTIAYWTGTDSGPAHVGIDGTMNKQYATYRDGTAAFYKKLNARMRQEFPGSKWIIDPARLYESSASWSDEFLYQIKERSDRAELTPDLILQEGAGTQFVDKPENFDVAGVPTGVTRDRVGCAQRTLVEEDVNRLIAAKAAINGAWYNWYGQWGIGGTSMPNFQDIRDVYPRLKLVRCVPNWDNLSKVPLASRSWDGGVYESDQSYLSRDIIYSRQPKTGKLFVVFLTHQGAVRLAPNERVVSVSRADGYFQEAGDGRSDMNWMGQELRLKSSVSIAVADGGEIMGNGYVIVVDRDGGPASDGGQDGGGSLDGGSNREPPQEAPAGCGCSSTGPAEFLAALCILLVVGTARARRAYGHAPSAGRAATTQSTQSTPAGALIASRLGTARRQSRSVTVAWSGCRISPRT